jgi:hypothetical protein
MVFDDFPFWVRFAHFINIILVSDYKDIGKGQGGHREDHLYYSPRAEI